MLTELDPKRCRLLRELKPNAVYLFEQNNQKCVLKLDYDRNHTANILGTIRAYALIMAHVTGEERLSEIHPLSLRSKDGLIKNFLLPLRTYNTIAERTALERVLNDSVFYIMPYIQELTNIDPFERSEDPEFQMARSALQYEPKIYRSLGRIIVADAFMGNCDRVGSLLEASMQNPGNYMLTWDSGKFRSTLRFIGLDFLDTQGSKSWDAEKQWAQILEQLSGPGANEKDLKEVKLMAKGKKIARDSAAGNVVGGMIAKFQSYRVSFEIPDAARKEIRIGISEGRAKLKEFAAKKMFHADWPSGLASRFEAWGFRVGQHRWF